VLLYAIAVLWVLNFSTKRLWLKVVLVAVEALLIVAVSMTMSRGGVVVLVCAAVFMRWVYKRHAMDKAAVSEFRGRRPTVRQPSYRVFRWFSCSPLWRVALVLCNPGMWGRSAPGYVVQDASIGNRFELWKGAAKLISTSPLGGWGFDNTGAAYMNWFQSVDNHTFYKGTVNSFLQLAVAYGLPVLFAVLLVSLLALLGAKRLVCGGAEPLKKSIGLLCFLWILIWMISSCFSTMLSSLLLFVPPMLAVLVMLVIHPPQMSELRGALVISLSVCVLIFVAGLVLARGDPVTIERDVNGMVTVSNREIKTGRTCLVYADQQVLGEYFGKEVRKLVTGSNFRKCVVVDKAGYATVFGEKPGTADLIILSGNTVGQAAIKNGTAKYALLNPSFLPDAMPDEAIQAIVYPEINRTHRLEPDTDTLKKFQAKIRMVPYNECFETSWAKYAQTEVIHR